MPKLRTHRPIGPDQGIRIKFTDLDRRDPLPRPLALRCLAIAGPDEGWYRGGI